MTTKKLLLVLFVSAIFIGHFIGCTPQKRSNENGWPNEITYGFAADDNLTDYNRFRGILAKYLANELGIETIHLKPCSEYAAVIEAMKSGKVDIAVLGGLSYIIAHERAGAQALVRRALTDTTDSYTSSILITHPSSGIRTMDDVKRNAHKLRMGFGDPASTSGHLFPRNYLNSVGIDPEEDFEEVIFTNSHTTSIFSVKTQSLDLAWTYRLAVDRLTSKDRLTSNDYHIVVETKPYITSPVLCRKELPEDFKKALQQAYIDLPIKHPEIWKQYVEGIYYYYPKQLRDKFIFIESNDEEYDFLRDVIRNTKGFENIVDMQ